MNNWKSRASYIPTYTVYIHTKLDSQLVFEGEEEEKMSRREEKMEWKLTPTGMNIDE